MKQTVVPKIKEYFLKLQQTFCQDISKADGKGSFSIDQWQRNEGGGGITRVMKQGKVIEQGGVNFSHVFGSTLPTSATNARPELKDTPFEAMGVSVVLHPHNPYIPTVHANIRFFIAESPQKKPIWWFGGGFDLTPYFPFEEDCIHWHQMAKNACDPFGDSVYSTYKKTCDDYFFLKHRNEARGIGGIFFDDLNQWSLETCFQFSQSVGDHFLKAYLPILTTRKDTIFNEKDRAFQLYRRGRYVEFNLIYDRGTLFGLHTGGRTESILMSLPPEVTWHYNDKTDFEQEEKNLLQYLKPRDWVK